MTPTKRIFINVLATYGRSLFALIFGLFTGRWILMALGKVDYGLYGLVGGITAFITFFNSIFSTGVSRFYAFSIGVASQKGNQEKGLNLCQQWFNTAILLHTLIPVVTLCIGYPIGVWAIKHFLTIPADRIESCVWVFRFVCLSCFVGMVNVPFRAMYTAKQEIAELTVYSFIQTACNFICTYYMVSHPRDWLVGYALFACAISTIPNLIIAMRAVLIYKECTFNHRYLFLPSKIIELGKFVGAYFWGAITGTVQTNGLAILVNKFMGPQFNASMAVGNTVTSHTLTLSSSLTGAFSPAVSNAAGEGDLEKMKKYAFRTCKYGAVLFLLFCIPASLEIDELMRLWLSTPPEGASFICLFLILGELAEKVTEGYSLALFAEGCIGKYQFWIGNDCLFSLLCALVFLYMGLGLLGVGLSILILKSLVIVIRLICGKTQVNMPVMYWVLKLGLPLTFVTVIVLGVGALTKVFMAPSLLRIIWTTLVCEITFMPLVWYMILNVDERKFFVEKIKARFYR